MKITVLVENSTSCRLYGEHGLSVYIEYDGKKYLLDTGASTLFAKNAKELGISLADIDLYAGHFCGKLLFPYRNR